MSKYARQPLDLERPRRPFRSASAAAKFASKISPNPTRAAASRAGWIPCRTFWRRIRFAPWCDAIADARARQRMILWGLGGHVIKCGLAPVLIDLMRRGYATAFALNGAAAIHDFEIAIAGQTSEDVEAVLPDGRFGTAEETGREMNAALQCDDGFGEALGRHLEKIADPQYAGREPALPGLPQLDARHRTRRHRHRHAARASGSARRRHRPRVASRFPPALRAGERDRHGRRLSECGIRGAACPKSF